jgi:hypothetical protein
MKNKKITEKGMLNRLKPGTSILSPLIIRSIIPKLGKKRCADARIKVSLPDSTTEYSFVIETKSQNTPLAVKTANAQVKMLTSDNEYPMIMVPYLSPERLEELEREKISGVDLCGNGIVIVPDKLYIRRTGNKNLYPTSRPLVNPYSGRSAMVGRILMSRSRWESLTKLVAAIEKEGAKLSLSQVSKAISAMEEDLIVIKTGNEIKLKDPIRLLDKLGQSWKNPEIYERQGLQISPNLNWQKALSANPELKWAITGESSVIKYSVFSQSGPVRIAVSNLPDALKQIEGMPERVPNFADIELIETTEPGFYYMNNIKNNIRWASPIQTWLELQSGDARQRDAAEDLRNQILKD